MEEKITFKVKDANGVEKVCEVLLTFKSDETKKEYVVYTDNSTDDEGNVKVYASAYTRENDSMTLLAIETDAEWKTVENALKAAEDEIRRQINETEEE